MKKYALITESGNLLTHSESGNPFTFDTKEAAEKFLKDINGEEKFKLKRVTLANEG